MISWRAECSSKRLRVKRRDENIISFSNRDLVRVHNPNNDPIIVSMIIGKYPIKRILIDSGSSIDIFFYDAFVRVNLPLNKLKPISMPLVTFNEESVEIEGEITLPIIVGTSPQQGKVFMTFMVVRMPSVYNVILKYSGLNQLDAIISTKCLLIHFLTKYKIDEMHGDYQLAG